ncbi:hypothetical protein CDAR_442411 [Caerostris darwini]|uniref:Uncharacterized protein n=1 Tax=Caerostris darwini TaxID=1538125 RepID=A0AAV4V0N9_9ARAC|nr:hypothetical protein CDAR_442411 [Caerostris darwini]
MPPKQISVLCKRRLAKEQQKRQENSQNESSKDGQVERANTGERTVGDDERILERNRPNKLQHRTPEQRERRRPHMQKAKKGKGKGITVEPTIVFIQKADIEPDPESSASECMVVKNDKKDKGDVTPVEPDVVVKEVPTEFDIDPTAYLEIVLKDELTVSDEEHTLSSADVLHST